MLNILLNGCGGRLARAIIDCTVTQPQLCIATGVDPSQAPTNLPFAIYPSLQSVPVPCTAHVVLDVSLPKALPDLLRFCGANHLPLVIATTGYGQAEFALLQQHAGELAILQSGNMSLGVHLLKCLVRQAARVLGDSFDIEIVEQHHNQKLDAPSGTALLLGQAANEGLCTPRPFVYDRHSKREPRPKNEIGMHSLRGGSIVGEHSVLFAGYDEVLELRHRAESKRIFALGCLAAVRFLQDKPPGLYTMDDVLAAAPCG